MSAFPRLSDPAYLSQRRLAADVRNTAARYAKGRLLDVGCGNRPYEPFFTGRVVQYVGLDQDPTNASAELHGSAEKIPARAGSFDTVLSTQTLEHLARPERALSEMARVLAPGGFVILSAPACFRLHEEPHDYFRFTEHGLTLLLSRVGLDVVEIRRAPGSLGHAGLVLAGALAGRPVLWRLIPLVNLFFRAADWLLPDAKDPANLLVVARRARRPRAR